MMNTLKNLLGDNAEEKIQSVLSALGNSSQKNSFADTVSENSPSSSESTPSFNADALESIGKIKSVIDDMGKATDSRSNLLMSLKPYMRTERKKSIDSAIKILNLSKFSGLFKL